MDESIRYSINGEGITSNEIQQAKIERIGRCRPYQRYIARNRAPLQEQTTPRSAGTKQLENRTREAFLHSATSLKLNAMLANRPFLVISWSSFSKLFILQVPHSEIPAK